MYQADIGIKSDNRLTRIPLFCRNSNNAIRRFGPIDSDWTGIFQNIDAFDIHGIDILHGTVVNDTVQYDQGSWTCA